MSVDMSFFSRATVLLLLFNVLSPAHFVYASALDNKIDRLLQKKCLDRSQTAISLVSIPDGRQVYARHIQKPLLPASIQKVVTSATALAKLSPEYRFHTRLLYTGKRKGDTIQGDLILRGGGDPMLKSADLQRLAVRLSKSGIRHITGNLIADIHLFDSYDRAPAWKEKRSQRAYDAQIGPLSIDFNTLQIHVRPHEKKGKPVDVWLDPAPAYISIDNQTRTVKVRKGRNPYAVWARRGELQPNENGLPEMRIHLRGKLGISAHEQVLVVNIDNPTFYAIESFRQYLSDANVKVGGLTRVSNQLIKGKLLYKHTSPPLSFILKELNTYSNNFMAEQILKTLAVEAKKVPASHEEGIKVVMQFLKELRVNTEHIQIVDGSGLSRKNRFTAQAMTDLLLKMYSRFDIGPDFLSVLRVMGANGVHSKRLKRSPAKGKIRAKTGTLNRVSTLTGYVPDKKGNLYAFSFFLNNHRCGYSGADQIEDGIIKAVYEIGETVLKK
jgi:D-alanyl-D-alanine carboxypeptidase/D-alanyl-D-alanine-endopeptidase (penicillin-binding protein 4)